jgi:dihydrofolate reductase
MIFSLRSGILLDMEIKHTIHSIAAIGEKNRVIGNGGEIPWSIKGEQKRFKEITTGHPIIMGRKTYESIGRALPGRTNIVITRSDNAYEGSVTVHSVEEAIETAKKSEGSEEIFIIGGGAIYEAALPYTDVLNLTIVHGDFEGDAFYPDYSAFTKEISKEEHLDNETPHTFINLSR